VYLVRAMVSHRGPGLCEESDVARLIDALWAHSVDSDGLEHIRGRSRDDSVEMILFLREFAGSDPELRAVSLITRAFHHSAAMRAAFDQTPRAQLCGDVGRSLAE
jgi:hypothetical protein